ncbi:conserved membrane hypothetical protein [Gammaproteobacteria bacterium]
MRSCFKNSFLFWALLFFATNILADTQLTLESDQVKVGNYVVSIHDLNFGVNTFGADFWIWADYSNPRLQPLKTMEFVNAKSISSSLLSSQLRESVTWSQQKIQGTFRHSWDMTNFPFDRHVLSIVMEESIDDISNLRYLMDTKNSGYLNDIIVDGFLITNMEIKNDQRNYNTNFGDPNAPPKTIYSRLIINLEIQRISKILFIKLHTALYSAFLVTAFCFPLLAQIPKIPQIVGSVLSAIVGSLFASIINLRTADSVIGGSESLTLVDRLHFITFLYFIILAIITITILINRERWNSKKISNVTRWAGKIYIVSYVAANLFLVWLAAF